jgi:hypothetical protein
MPFAAPRETMVQMLAQKSAQMLATREREDHE